MKKITFLIILLSNLVFSQKSFEATYKVEFGYFGVMVPPVSVKWCHFERFYNYS